MTGACYVLQFMSCFEAYDLKAMADAPVHKPYIKTWGQIGLGLFFGSWLIKWLCGKVLKGRASKEIAELNAKIDEEKAKFFTQIEEDIRVAEGKMMKECPEDYAVGAASV